MEERLPVQREPQCLLAPDRVPITPDKSLALARTALPEYTVTGRYYKTPSELSAATDTPALPTRYHMLIVYRAMMLYGAFEAAQELYAMGEQGFTQMMKILSNTNSRDGSGGATGMKFLPSNGTTTR